MNGISFIFKMITLPFSVFKVGHEPASDDEATVLKL